MSDLLYEFRAVMLYKLDKDVSEESISQFTLEKMKKDVEENKEKFESGVRWDHLTTGGVDF